MSVDLGTISLSFDSGPAKQGAAEVEQAIGRIDKAVERTTKTLAQVRAEQDRVANSQRKMAESVAQANQAFARTLVETGNLEKAGRNQALALTQGLRSELQRSRADIVELQLQGLISPAEARVRGQEAAMAFNRGLLQVINQRGVAGNLQGQAGQALFVGLTSQAQAIKAIEPATASASRGLGNMARSMASLAAQSIGVRAGLGPVISTLGSLAVGSAVTLGVVAAAAAIAFGFKKMGEAAKEAEKRLDDLNAKLARAKQASDPLLFAQIQSANANQAVIEAQDRLQALTRANVAVRGGQIVDLPDTKEIAAARRELFVLKQERLLTENEVNGLRKKGDDEAADKAKRIAAERLSQIRRLEDASLAALAAEARARGDLRALEQVQIDQKLLALDRELKASNLLTAAQLEQLRIDGERAIFAERRARAATIERAAIGGLTPRVGITQGQGLIEPGGLAQVPGGRREFFRRRVPFSSTPLGGPDPEKEAAAREKNRRALQDATFAVVAFGNALAQITGSKALGRAFGGAAQGAALGSAIAPGIGTAIGAGVGFLGGLFGGDGGAEKRRRQEERDAARAAVRGFVEDVRRAGLTPLARALDEVSQRFSAVRAEALRVGVPFAEAARVAAEEITRLRNEFVAQERQTQQGLRAEILSLSGDEAGGARLELQLRNQREAEQALADGLGVTTQGLIAQVGALREAALARQQELDALRKTAEDAAFGQSILGREAALRGDALGEARANAEAAAIAQRAEAEELRRAGRIGEGLFKRLADVIDGELRGAIEGAESALTNLREDLDIRLLRATGRGAEADTLARQREREDELDRLRQQGAGEDVLALAARVQAEEERNRLAGLSGPSGGRLDQIATTAGLTAQTETTALRIDSSLFTIAFLARDIRDDVRAIRNATRSNGANVSVVFEGGASSDQSRIIDAVTRAVDVGASQALAVTNSASGVRSLA